MPARLDVYSAHVPVTRLIPFFIRLPGALRGTLLWQPRNHLSNGKLSVWSCVPFLPSLPVLACKHPSIPRQNISTYHCKPSLRCVPSLLLGRKPMSAYSPGSP